MENLTIGWLSENIGFLIVFIGGLYTIYNAIKKLFNKGLEPIVKQIESVESSLKKEMQKIDMNSTKNFLVARINEVEQGQKLDPVTLERFWEEYEHYVKDLDGNSYIKERVEKLKSKKKL